MSIEDGTVLFLSLFPWLPPSLQLLFLGLDIVAEEGVYSCRKHELLDPGHSQFDNGNCCHSQFTAIRYGVTKGKEEQRWPAVDCHCKMTLEFVGGLPSKY